MAKSAQYIFRLDDVCATMDAAKFAALGRIFDQYGIKPIVGVVPDNQDPHLKPEVPDPNFWQMIRSRQQQGWIIAQHGYQHSYVNHNSGLLNIQPHSEFAGLPYDEQLKKIAAGKSLLEKQLGSRISWWMSPSHSFDVNTCKALVELKFQYITDGVALWPFKKHGLTWIPQQLWHPHPQPFGLWTICLHPNSMSSQSMSAVSRFIRRYQAQCQQADFAPRFSILNIPFKMAWYAALYAKKL